MIFRLLCSIIGCSLVVQGSVVVSARIIHVSNTNISTLHEYLDNSYHEPLCVVLIKGQQESKLKRRVVNVWLTNTQSGTFNLSSWILATVNTTQVQKLPRYLLRDSYPEQSPLLRCFLAPILSHDLDAADATTKRLRQWLRQLMAQHDQLLNGGVDMIEASVSLHRFTVVVFPTTHQHEELEQATFQVVEALSKDCDINTIVIHPSSTHLKDVVEKYRVTNLPSVLVIEKEADKGRQQTLFNIHDIMTGRMETDMRARLIPARQFTLSDFQLEVARVSQGKRYRPFLIGFYAHWEKGTAVFLSFLQHTVLEFRSLGADMQFGLVDAARSPEVVSHYMSPMCLQHLPFLAVFHADEGKMTVNQTELLVTRPTPFTVYSALQEAGLDLTDSHQQPISYQPYGRNTQVCLWTEGPHGDHCSSDNTSWSFAADSSMNSMDSCSTQGTDVAGEEAETMYRIPLATPADLHAMGKTSDGDEDDMTVFINIFIFIRHTCKSCEESQPLFHHIYQQLSANDSLRVRMVNCSRTAAFCERHHVTGFPTVLAFRRHSTPARCFGACSGKSDCASTIRQDYHGALTGEALMDWIAKVSVSSIQSLHFSKPFWTKKETAQLIATVIPLDSEFLPLPPHKNRGYFYTIHCFRELCERLFGLVACFTVNSPNVPQSQFDSQTVHLAVAQVDFRRHDGIEMTLMQLGQSLADLLDKETDNALHMFHTHHSYKLPRKQKCEDDHGHCTLFLESFARDHLRLPVTSLTSDILHSHNEFLFGKEAPVLLALVEEDYSTEFQQMLQNIAYTFYKDVVVATLDVTAYRAWAGSFVPRDYNRLHAESSSWGELGVYPRFCLFYWHDHTRAAFHPPVKATSSGSARLHFDAPPDDLTEDSIAEFVRRFLQDPAGSLVETERF